VPASRRMGVHAPDIKEEFKEFKEYWGGAAFAVSLRTRDICCSADRYRNLWKSRRLPGTTQRGALCVNPAPGF
jgi:hypothetical protein